ncbi:MAG: GAF domain-containing protein [Candidatus Dormibacteraeota bacterium]|uniref:GAF domain-containing protein n=1 Tax=Candidatus Nephthysia bennettiae TaxID=3127016 RepID=A0A934KD67_9BACT|nr:GAF domain-containing protein [Candidatus Dormibacteraeota bacterium]MBJ7611003.1 GAF domain-containing protein [Candidatus Dormibacteraeota bacterium]
MEPKSGTRDGLSVKQVPQVAAAPAFALDGLERGSARRRVVEKYRQRGAQAELTFLRRLLATSAAAVDHPSLLRAVIDETREATRSDVCSLYLWEPELAELVLTATNGLSKDGIGRARLRLGQGITGAVAEQGRPLSVPDVRLDPRFEWIQGLDQERFLSMLSVPVLVGDRLVGVLNVQTSEVRHHRPDEVELLMAIGGHVAGIIQKSALLEELRLLHRQRTELLTTLGHEIGSALTVARSHLRGVISRAGPELREPAILAAEELDVVQEHSRRALRALEMEAGESPLHLRVTDPVRVARQAARRLRAMAPGRVQTHWSASAALVRCDPEAIERALLNIADDALRSSPPDQPILLEVEVSAGRVGLAVHDRRDRAGASVRDGGAAGGQRLQMVRRIAEGHGGTLAVRPRAGGGTVVAIELAAEEVS